MSGEGARGRRLRTLLRHVTPRVHAVAHAAAGGSNDTLEEYEASLQQGERVGTWQDGRANDAAAEASARVPRALLGFPHTTATATVFSRAKERVFRTTQRVVPQSTLVEMPKGDPPPLARLFGPSEVPRGHVCVTGPTGSGKSTIVRGVLCALAAQRSMIMYTLEFPVEVSMETHGLFTVNQIDMLQYVNGRQRSLANTAHNLLAHDPDLIYFGELRSKIDFETATSVALSGVPVISTGHAHSPMDLLERLRSMNIDLSTQFRAMQCILGVNRVPILCTHCKRRIVLRGKPDHPALKLLHAYRSVALPRSRRKLVAPTVCMPPPVGEREQCKHCDGGYSHNHTIYEYLYLRPDETLEELRKRHVYSTEETLFNLILQGQVNPLYLENVL